MRTLIAICAILLIACDGKLSDEQRRKMREQMELHEIKRVTETEITEAAYAKGRSLMAAIETTRGDSTKIDSIIASGKGRYRFIIPGKSNALALEQQLVDAYLADESGAIQDNVQQLRRGAEKSDSILYTKPIVTKLPDGTERLDGIWNIWLSQKELILTMDRK
jgi:Flp pilus assembly protein TadD